MINVPEIRKWLQKMQYTDPNPSEESLNILCKGGLGLVFGQIINKVKPMQEVTNQNATNCFSITDLSNSFFSDTDSRESKYSNSQNLEDTLHALHTYNVGNELNVQHLTNKIKLKNFNRQLMAQKVEILEKENILLKAKSMELDNQIDLCENLESQHNLMQQSSQKNNHISVETINVVIENIEQSFEKLEHQLSISDQELLPIAENPHTSYLQTSVILSSNKKPLSTKKCPKRANSTCKNIFETPSNFSLMSSTLKKRNMSKICEHSFNNTMLSTIPNIIGKYTEVLKELELISWKDKQIREFVDEIWHFGSHHSFKMVSDLQSHQKNKIIKLIANNDNSKNVFSNEDQNIISSLEILYASHVQTELKKLHSKQQQLKVSKMLERSSDEFITDILMLEATEVGLSSSVRQLQQRITKILDEYSDKTEKLNQLLVDIQDVKSAILATESQIETNQCILRSCNSSLENWRKSVNENMKDSILDTDHEWLEGNIAEKETQSFISCPILEYNPMDSIMQVFKYPELKNLHSSAFLKPDTIMRQEINQKRWLDKLEMIQKSEDLYDIEMRYVGKNLFDVELTNDLYKMSSEKLKWVSQLCIETSNRVNDINTELNCNLKTTLNDCLAEHVQNKNKKFNEFVDKYDEYYKLL